MDILFIICRTGAIRRPSMQEKNYRTSNIITRYEGNPILKAEDVPYDSDLVSNPGVCKYKGKYIMVFRNDIRESENKVREGVYLGLAISDDGINWDIQEKPCFDMSSDEIHNTYDPRITVINGKCFMTFGMDTNHGVRGGIAVTEDFKHFDLISMSAPDNRNFVIFPEKINGNYVRLERPFPIYGRPGYPERFDIWISQSPDLVYWGKSELLLGVEHVPYANLKLGAGPPPIKTDKGWLVIFHASDFDPNRGKNGYEDVWQKRYMAGVMLLDIDNPYRVIAISKDPLIVPEAEYETKNGYRNNVVFPTGIILEEDLKKEGEVKIYYGAADTSIALATTNVDDLIAFCDMQIS